MVTEESLEFPRGRNNGMGKNREKYKRRSSHFSEIILEVENP